MLALRSPQVIRSVLGRRKEVDISQPGENINLLSEQMENITLLSEQSGTNTNIETISLAIAGSDRPETKGIDTIDRVTRLTNELRKLSVISLTISLTISLSS